MFLICMDQINKWCVPCLDVSTIFSYTKILLLLSYILIKFVVMRVFVCYRDTLPCQASTNRSFSVGLAKGRQKLFILWNRFGSEADAPNIFSSVEFIFVCDVSNFPVFILFVWSCWTLWKIMFLVSSSLECLFHVISELEWLSPS